MSRPNKDTRAKRAFKKALLYTVIIAILMVILFIGLIVMRDIDLPFGYNIKSINLIWLILFGFVYIFAYFKDYLDEINEKLDRIERKLNDK